MDHRWLACDSTVPLGTTGETEIADHLYEIACKISPAMQLQFGNSSNGCFQKWWVLPPKSSILIGISIINHPFWGTPIFGNTQIALRFCAFVFFLGESSAAGSPSVLRLLSITLHTASHATFDFGKWILAQSSASTSSGLGEVHGKLEWTCFRRCVYDYQIDCVFEKNLLNTWKLNKMMSLKYVRGASSGPSWRGSRPEFEGSCGWHFFQERSEIVRILCISSDFSCFASACSCFANSIERCTPSWPSQASPSSSSERSSLRCLQWICTVKQKPCILSIPKRTWNHSELWIKPRSNGLLWLCQLPMLPWPIIFQTQAFQMFNCSFS